MQISWEKSIPKNADNWTTLRSMMKDRELRPKPKLENKNKKVFGFGWRKKDRL